MTQMDHMYYAIFRCHWDTYNHTAKSRCRQMDILDPSLHNPKVIPGPSIAKLTSHLLIFWHLSKEQIPGELQTILKYNKVIVNFSIVRVVDFLCSSTENQNLSRYL